MKHCFLFNYCIFSVVCDREASEGHEGAAAKHCIVLYSFVQNT